MWKLLKWLFGRQSTVRILYSDQRNNAKVLFSAKYNLQGKPDYILEDEALNLIPVEIKSVSLKRPDPGHVLQLAAYCLLIEEALHRSVRYGVIEYANRSFKIPWNNKLRYKLLSALTQMQLDLSLYSATPTHNRNKCTTCYYKKVCHR